MTRIDDAKFLASLPDLGKVLRMALGPDDSTLIVAMERGVCLVNTRTGFVAEAAAAWAPTWVTCTKCGPEATHNV